MTAPRLEIKLAALAHNARVLVDRLGPLGVGVTGVTKATLGNAEIARALLGAGVATLGDSRIENIEALRLGGIAARIALIRTPMLSQVDRVVRNADVSFNTELEVIVSLSAAAGRNRRTHQIVLMVELGDLREGIMPADLVALAGLVHRLPNITLAGIGTNLACQSGVVPDAGKMAELTALAASVEAALGLTLEVISGGNSANLDWALSGAGVGRVNDLRLGESILLGREPLGRRPIAGLRTDAFTLVAEVIESKRKPGTPWGRIAQTAFGEPAAMADRGPRTQTILALGEQDVDPLGLEAPDGTEILGASSDHLVLVSAAPLLVGTELRLQPNYSALLRSMTSPTVAKRLDATPLTAPRGAIGPAAAPVLHASPTPTNRAC